MPLSQKDAGAYYTPDHVVSSLLKWAVRDDAERLLDPSCGDGRFIAGHRYSVGIEQDERAASMARARAPGALVHRGDFFTWAAATTDRFDCAAGNPPFIRYQTFKGEVRARALELCAGLGAEFSGLTSSWPPFLVAAASLLLPGGRMAFVVPAEIGHAPYAAPLMEYLVAHFSTVHVVAVRDKLFPDLSEDCWLLYAAGFGDSTRTLRFSVLHRFQPSARPPRAYIGVNVSEWRSIWKRRLRPFLISGEARDLYRNVADADDSARLGDLANVGIGYVSGANDFFHLRPSEAKHWDIPEALLLASVRNGRALQSANVTADVVARWRQEDEPILLLRLPKTTDLPRSVVRYLDTDAGRTAREGYKCRTRDPWYSVPDVQVPDFFLSYMSGREASLVGNKANCTCTNSVHSVRLKTASARRRLGTWRSAFTQLSCELEGHPLGGGMLKLEPREATQVILPASGTLGQGENRTIAEAIDTMRAWRHYGEA